jgi:hypothetical protein
MKLIWIVFYKLGKVITSKNTKGPKTIYFQKINFEIHQLILV